MQGKNTIEFILQNEVSSDCDITHVSFVLDFKLLKTEKKSTGSGW